MENGYIKLHRSLFQHGIWSDNLGCRLFLWLFGHAVFGKDKHYSEVTVKRGQYLRSYRNLGEDLTYIENNKLIRPVPAAIKRKVDLLIDMKMITTLETRLGTLFTITNFEKYQGNGTEMKQIGDTEFNQMGRLETALGTMAEQTLNNNKKDKNEKKDIYMSEFDEARKIYQGSRRGLPTEFNNFKRHNDWQVVLSLLKPAIEKEKLYKQELKNQAQFCPPWKNFHTWINKRCWEQELPQLNKSINQQNETIWKPA